MLPLNRPSSGHAITPLRSEESRTTSQCAGGRVRSSLRDPPFPPGTVGTTGTGGTAASRSVCFSYPACHSLLPAGGAADPPVARRLPRKKRGAGWGCGAPTAFLTALRAAGPMARLNPGHDAVAEVCGESARRLQFGLGRGRGMRYSLDAFRARSSVGQSRGLIILWSQVRALPGPPTPIPRAGGSV